jgi:hypothetical protein
LSILTKVCIVILVVLIPLASVVFISTAAIVPNYRAAYIREKEVKEIREQETRVAVAALESTKAQYALAMARKDKELGARQERIVALQENGQKKDLQITNLTTQVASERELAKDALKQAETQLQVSKAQAAQMETMRTNIADLNRHLIVERKLKTEAEARADRSEAAERLVREEMAEKDSEIARLREVITKLESGMKVSGSGQPMKVAAPQIVGTVTAVQGNLASINIGRTKGVKEGDVFIVHRLDQYICKLQIDQVQLGQAAGVIVDKKMAPKVNDKVINKIPIK